MAGPSAAPVKIALVEDDDETRGGLVASIRFDLSLLLIGEYCGGDEALVTRLVAEGQLVPACCTAAPGVAERRGSSVRRSAHRKGEAS